MLFGYFGGTDYLPRPDPTLAEIADHCTLGFLGTWGLNTGNPVDLARWHFASIKAGTAAGINAWCLGIDVLVYDIATWEPNLRAAENLRVYLGKLAKIGALEKVVALYPIDEANDKGVSEGTVRWACGEIRAALREIDRADIKLVACNSGLERPRRWQKILRKWFPSVMRFAGERVPFPAMDEHEIVGADDYDLGAAILPQYERLLKRLRADQQLMLLPGASSPWKQDLAPFLEWAAVHRERVWAIVPFAYFDVENYIGARSNGMADIYRKALL